MPAPNICATASSIVCDVIHKRISLDKATVIRLSKLPQSNWGETREISWGAIRWYHYYLQIINKLLQKPLHKNDLMLEGLLLCSLYQLDHMRAPNYAIVSSAVEACRLLDRAKACGLVNAILRQYLKQTNTNKSAKNDEYKTMPSWLLNILRTHWPHHLEQIIDACNGRPPMTLRVNRQRCTVNAYLEHLEKIGLHGSKSTISDVALTLSKPLPVNAIPGFNEGQVSVQDAAAQLTPLFAGKLEGRILDACASPGGKTCHLLESSDGKLDLTALDLHGHTELIESNLQRLGLEAKIVAGDATKPESWWDNQYFNCIILDAPCSATGVIRRHPDIRIHRRNSDIYHLAKRQLELLTSLWPLVAKGGRIVYVTCSIIPEENDHIIEQFVDQKNDVIVKYPPIKAGLKTKFGRQLLPQVGDADGFYYAVLERNQS